MWLRLSLVKGGSVCISLLDFSFDKANYGYKNARNYGTKTSNNANEIINRLLHTNIGE